MNLFKKLFKKKTNRSQNMYAYLGSIGISPNKMYIYQESIKLIKEFETKYKRY